MSLDVSTADCDNCKRNKNNFKTEERRKLLVCFDIDILINPDNKKTAPRREQLKRYKKDKLKEILRKVSALRNSGGGSLLIHMQKMTSQNRSTTHLSEYLDTHLNDLIEDGSPFETEYYKAWYDESSKDECQYLVLTVSGSSSVSTADYKTKVPLDYCILRPTSQNMDRYMVDVKEDGAPSLVGLKNVVEECRNIQFKTIQPQICASKLHQQRITDYIWEDLRLSEYITSFSKLPNGGSYYIGVTERGHLGSAGIRFDGIRLPEQEHGDLLRDIYKRLRSEIIRVSDKIKTPRTLDERNVRIGFHPVEGGNFVVEIAVAPVSGCVFYDKEGPEAYVMTGDRTMERMTFKEWLGSFEKRNKKPCQKCLNSLCEDCKEVFAQ